MLCQPIGNVLARKPREKHHMVCQVVYKLLPTRCNFPSVSTCKTDKFQVNLNFIINAQHSKKALIGVVEYYLLNQ